MRRIGRQQNMQQSCSAARQTDDEQRFANFLLRDVGINLAIAHKQESIGQNPDDIASERHFPDQVEPRFAVARLQQTRERFDEFALSKIRELATSLRFLDQFACRNRFRTQSDFLQRGSAFVEQTNRNWSASLLDRIGGAHTSTIVAGATESKSQLRRLRRGAGRSIVLLMTTEKATFGAGCFWGVEETFRNLKGVTSTAVGYAGGNKENPSYEDVCTDETGHAEVVQLEFDPAQISYDQLLGVFWSTHNPMTLNRQGPDVGTQYRSAIFYHSPEQKAAAEASKQKLDASGKFSRPIVTQIEPAPKFWRAEEYHQRYLEKIEQSHCAI